MVEILLITVGGLAYFYFYNAFPLERKAVLKEFANRHGAIFREPTPFQGPRVEIEHEGSKVFIEGRRSSTDLAGRLRLSARIHVSKSDHLLVTTEPILGGIGKKLGVQDIETSDPQFDDKFLVQGSNEQRVFLFLTEEIRRELVRLLSRGPWLEIKRGKLVLSIIGVVDYGDSEMGYGLDAFLKFGTELVDAAKSAFPGP